MYINEQFSKKLQSLMKSKGYSALALSQELGASSVTVSNWVNGRNLPSADMLVHISKLFNVSIDSLLSEDEEISYKKSKSSAKNKVLDKLQRHMNKEEVEVSIFDNISEDIKFGKKLERIMGYRNMCIKDFANALGVTTDVVKSWINETSVPDLHQLIGTCDVLHVSMDRLAYSRSPVTCIPNRGLTVKDCDMLRYIADVLATLH